MKNHPFGRTMTSVSPDVHLVEAALARGDTAYVGDWVRRWGRVRQEKSKELLNRVIEGDHAPALISLLAPVGDPKAAACRAVSYRRPQHLQVLLALAEDRERMASRALITACFHNNTEAITPLLEAGADPAFDQWQCWRHACRNVRDAGQENASVRAMLVLLAPHVDADGAFWFSLEQDDVASMSDLIPLLPDTTLDAAAQALNQHRSASAPLVLDLIDRVAERQQRVAHKNLLETALPSPVQASRPRM